MQTPACLLLLCAAVPVFADQIVMQNGDLYHGAVLTLTTNVVVLQNENLGSVTIPRAKVSAIYLGDTPVAAVPSNRSASAPSSLSSTNSDLSAMVRGIRSQTNFVQQVQAQILGSASPDALNKFNELLEGLSTGKMDMNGLRAEAQHAADQLRSFQKELGPDVDEPTSGYLAVLDMFLKQTAPPTAATNSASSLVK